MPGAQQPPRPSSRKSPAQASSEGPEQTLGSPASAKPPLQTARQAALAEHRPPGAQSTCCSRGCDGNSGIPHADSLLALGSVHPLTSGVAMLTLSRGGSSRQLRDLEQTARVPITRSCDQASALPAFTACVYDQEGPCGIVQDTRTIG
ncbi:hypothetical protein MJT46_006405 [Ovis ammon polii x Ovis aries]|nr:hypothetical protein MJT46_006405 [Ovis ammon polii x Ovis aries]